MVLHTFFLMLAGAVISNVLRLLLNRRTQFRWRSIDEVAPFLYQPDLEQLDQALDPQEDRRMRSARIGNYRRHLRVNLEIVRREYRILGSNALIGYQWGDTEWRDMIKHKLDYTPDLQEKIQDLRREGLHFLLAMGFMLARMWLLTLPPFEEWKFLPVPSAAALARIGRIDIREAYQRVKDATIALAAFYGDGTEFADEIGSRM